MPFGYYFDSTMIILIPAILFAMYAQFKVNSAFSKYSKYPNSRGITAAQVARRILDSNGLTDIRVERVSGKLTDNYNPSARTVYLSDSTYSSTSVAAIGVAAHECGHAVQHATGYLPIKIRAAIIPITNIGSSLSWIIILIGLLFSAFNLAMIGVILFSFTAVFQAVTLPVEFNASSRALDTLERDYILNDDELPMAKKVLSAAAMTYVAALVSSIASVLRLFLIVSSRTRRK